MKLFKQVRRQADADVPEGPKARGPEVRRATSRRFRTGICAALFGGMVE